MKISLLWEGTRCLSIPELRAKASAASEKIAAQFVALPYHDRFHLDIRVGDVSGSCQVVEFIIDTDCSDAAAEWISDALKREAASGRTRWS